MTAPISLIEALDASDALTELRARCKAAQVPVEDVLSEQRLPEAVAVRHAFWCWLHLDQGYSQSRIARWFGVDHSTVWAAVHGGKKAIKKRRSKKR